jgi:hypothetical protein
MNAAAERFGAKRPEHRERRARHRQEQDMTDSSDPAESDGRADKQHSAKQIHGA